MVFGYRNSYSLASIYFVHSRADEESEKKIYEIGGQVRLRFDATNYQYLEDLSYTLALHP